MTTAPTSPARPVILLRVAAVLAIVLALVDAGSAIPFLGDPMPIWNGVVIFVVAALTIVGAVAALLGRTWGIWLAAVTRFLSIASMIPVLLEPDAPQELVVPMIVIIVVTLVDVVLLLVSLRRRSR
jgi:hypothetical protein